MTALTITDGETSDLDEYRQIAKDPNYLKKLPYKAKAVFGYATLFDPRRTIKNTVFQEERGIPCMGLDEAEKTVMDYLIKGRYYSSTGMNAFCFGLMELSSTNEVSLVQVSSCNKTGTMRDNLI